MADHNDFGKIAEELAADFLSKNGYKIRARNFRYLKSEIDIIAEIEKEVIIVEVKARKNNVVLEPHEAVTPKKIRLTIAAADYFVREYDIEKNVRFDIITVMPDASGALQITHLPDAFEAIDAG